MNLHSSIIAISVVRNLWDATDSMPYFIGIPPHVIIFSVIEGIFSTKEFFRYAVDSKTIEELSGKQRLG